LVVPDHWVTNFFFIFGTLRLCRPQQPKRVNKLIWIESNYFWNRPCRFWYGVCVFFSVYGPFPGGNVRCWNHVQLCTVWSRIVRWLFLSTGVWCVVVFFRFFLSQSLTFLTFQMPLQIGIKVWPAGTHIRSFYLGRRRRVEWGVLSLWWSGLSSR
jgi:hypothetical protein